MKIGIITDTHNKIDNVRKVIKELEKKECSIIVHCGDICSTLVLEELSKFSGEIYCCLGNCDNLKDFENINFENLTLFDEIGELEINSKKIAFCHLPEIAMKLVFSKKYDLVFHGHTHKIRKEQVENTLIINSGEIMGHLGIPTYAIYDTKTNKVEFFELN